jgi:hypothetical protein
MTPRAGRGTLDLKCGAFKFIYLQAMTAAQISNQLILPTPALAWTAVAAAEAEIWTFKDVLSAVK